MSSGCTWMESQVAAEVFVLFFPLSHLAVYSAIIQGVFLLEPTGTFPY